jgi:hypothetical protein
MIVSSRTGTRPIEPLIHRLRKAKVQGTQGYPVEFSGLIETSLMYRNPLTGGKSSG